MIRTRLQGGTPFFPNMLNNGAVEVCLKEDVDRVLAEKDEEIRKWKAARDECERQFQEKVEEISELISQLNELRTVFKGWRSYKDDPPGECDDFIFCGHQKYEWEKEMRFFVDAGFLDVDNNLCMFHDINEGEEIFEIDYWFPMPRHPDEKL